MATMSKGLSPRCAGYGRPFPPSLGTMLTVSGPTTANSKPSSQRLPSAPRLGFSRHEAMVLKASRRPGLTANRGGVGAQPAIDRQATRLPDPAPPNNGLQPTAGPPWRYRPFAAPYRPRRS